MNLTRLLLSGLLLWLLPAVAGAYQLRTGETTNTLSIAPGDVLEDESLLIANAIHCRGNALHDLWMLASSTLQFEGNAEGDLRLMANSARIDGSARQNLLAYARNLQLTTNSVVEGQAAIFGTTVVCEGRIDKDAWIIAESATLGGQWDGNIRVQANEIKLVSGTTIAGNLVYISPKLLVYDSSVTVRGTVTRMSNLLPESSALSPSALQARFAFNGYLFLAALLAGMPFVGAFPLLAGGAVRKLKTSPWRVLFAGAITLLLCPFLIGFAFMSLVGIPLALLLMALYGSLVYLSHIVIALWIGHLILRPNGPQTFARVLSALGLGLFLLYFLAALPGVVSLVLLPVLLLGTGSLVLALLHRPLVALHVPPPPPPPLPNKPESTTSPE